MVTPIVMDVDTGTDDALAILYALAHPDLDLLGISCVAGNCSLERVLINTAKVLDAAGAGDVPFAAGATKPLIERARAEGHYHGADGLGGIELPESARTRSAFGAIELLRRLIMNAPEPITLIGLAPQTNLAMLLTQHPEVIDHLERVVFMGGSASVGNVTGVAEFNIWQDPEAATCVVESGLPTTMYGLDVFNRLVIPRETALGFRAADQPAINLAGELLLRRGKRADGWHQDYVGLIGDAGTLVWLTNPELFTTRSCPVRVNLTGLGRGQTIVDQRPIAQDAEALGRDPWHSLDVALDLDASAAAEQFIRVINSYLG